MQMRACTHLRKMVQVTMQDVHVCVCACVCVCVCVCICERSKVHCGQPKPQKHIWLSVHSTVRLFTDAYVNLCAHTAFECSAEPSRSQANHRAVCIAHENIVSCAGGRRRRDRVLLTSVSLSNNTALLSLSRARPLLHFCSLDMRDVTDVRRRMRAGRSTSFMSVEANEHTHLLRSSRRDNDDREHNGPSS